jgi:hypothetical protein
MKGLEEAFMATIRSSFGVALLGAALAFAGPQPRRAYASSPEAVALGEVSSVIERRDVDLRAMLRASAEEELRALDLKGVPVARRSILSVSLVRMDTAHATGDTDVTTCIVSATLRDAKRGAIFAVLEGRAHGDSGAGDRAILRTAVRGAVARIPEALRR